MPIELNSSDQPASVDRPSCAKKTYDKQGSSLLRKRVAGMSTRFWIGLFSLALLAMVPKGALHALRSMAHEPSNWRATASNAPLADEVAIDQHLLISWSSEATASLADTGVEAEQALLLRKKLNQLTDKEGWPWFPRIENHLASSVQADQAVKPTCLVAYLSPKLSNQPALSDEVIDRVRLLATEECGIPVGSLHLGGQFVEQAAMYQQSWWLLARMTPLAMLLGMLLVHRITRHEGLTALLTLLAFSMAAMSLAIVYYGGLFLASSSTSIVFSILPILVFAVVLSTSTYLLHYYRHAQSLSDDSKVASNCLRSSWQPIVFGLLCLLIGLVSLMACDLVIIQQFGLFTALSLFLGVMMLVALLPAWFDYFGSSVTKAIGDSNSLPTSNSFLDFLGNWTTRPQSFRSVGLLSACCLGISLFVAQGIGAIQVPDSSELFVSSVSQIGTDLAWFDEHFGSIDPVSMPVSVDRLSAPSSASFGLSQSLQMSLLITLISIACLAIVRWNRATAGLVVLLPTLAAVTILFGMIGWTQQPIGLGLLMSLGVAIGVSLSGTLHYLNWFEAARPLSVDRREAAKKSFIEAAPTMVAATLLMVIVLVPMACCTILPLQQFGIFLLLVSAVGLAMNLTLLPMLVAGNTGSCFEGALDSYQEALYPEAAYPEKDFNELVLRLPIHEEIHTNQLVAESMAEAAADLVEASDQRPPEIKVLEVGSDAPEILEALENLSQDATLAMSEATDNADSFESPIVEPEEPKAKSYAPKEPLSPENESLRKRLQDLRRTA